MLITTLFFPFVLFLFWCVIQDFVDVLIAFLCSYACDTGGPWRRQAFPGFLKVAHPLLCSPLGCAVSIASHSQPISVLAVAGCTLATLVLVLCCEFYYPWSVFWCFWWWTWALFPFLPPCGHRLYDRKNFTSVSLPTTSVPHWNAVPSWASFTLARTLTSIFTPTDPFSLEDWLLFLVSPTTG